jgi:hypothetical protein
MARYRGHPGIREKLLLFLQLFLQHGTGGLRSFVSRFSEGLLSFWGRELWPIEESLLAPKSGQFFLDTLERHILLIAYSIVINVRIG